MLVIIYHVLKDKTVYDEQKYVIPKQKQELKQIKNLEANAKKLGYSLVPIKQDSELGWDCVTYNFSFYLEVEIS